MGTELANTKDKLTTIRDALEARKGQLSAVLPRHMTPERMIRIAISGVLRQPKLLECNTASIIKSVVEASQLGLDCSGLLGSGYLVPYRNSQTGQLEAQFQPGYRGLIDLARRSGQIRDITAHVVYRDDKFRCNYGTAPVLEHEPAWDSQRGDDQIVAAYAVAFLEGGCHHSEVMTRSEIDAIRKRSKASAAGPWVTDYAEMARKTVVKRLIKYLPVSIELAEALSLDEKADGIGADMPIDLGEVVDAPAVLPVETSVETNGNSGNDKIKRKLRGRLKDQAVEEPPAPEQPAPDDAEQVDMYDGR